MKKIPNNVENFIIALFCVLVIHNVTLKPKSVTKSTLFLLTFSVLLCSQQGALRLASGFQSEVTGRGVSSTVTQNLSSFSNITLQTHHWITTVPLV